MDDNDFVIMDALFSEVKRLNADLQEEDAETEPDGRAMPKRCPLLAAASAIILAIQPSKVRGTADVCSGKRCAWYDESKKCCGIVSGKEQNDG